MKNSKLVTQTLPHIPLRDVNPGKLDKLNDLADVYMNLCQIYVHHFCTDALPDKFAEPFISTPLSERWQRVAIMQAAGIALSWRSNRSNAYQEFERKLLQFESKNQNTLVSQQESPVWTEFNIPQLKTVCIQANENVAKLTLESDLPLQLQEAKGQGFDYWIRISTLEKQKTLWIPIKLPKYHKERLKSQKVNSSCCLERRKNGSWWLSVSFDEPVIQAKLESPPVGIDVGISSFITTSTEKMYGTFNGKLKQQFERDREKRQRKAKLRACLEKKGFEKLPSTNSATGERLKRHVVQEINEAINQFFLDHDNNLLVIERLNLASMRFKSHRMNAQVRASHLGHLPKQLQWGAQKRGLPLQKVNPAYSSQECPICNYANRANRPNQQTFCCKVCGYKAGADTVAAQNIAKRGQDEELANCHTLEDVKDLLRQRHEYWRSQNGYS